jgi:hypothetical protein
MPVRVARFLSILLIAVSLGFALAHLCAMPNKLELYSRDYLVVQRIYRGWGWFAIPILGAIVTTYVVIRVQHPRPGTIRYSLIALLFLLLAQLDFWTFTYPVNLATHDWTIVPDNWLQLRHRWEYSHAAGAVLMLAALMAAIASALWEEKP